MRKKAFTLIELLVVIAIIGILATVVILNVASARAKALDAKRLSDFSQITKALDAYALDNGGQFPPATYAHGTSHSGWETSFLDGAGNFIPALAPYLSPTPVDPKNTDDTKAYWYYRYNGGSYGCNNAYFYVLGIYDLETYNGSRPNPASPGWSCSGRNWGNEYDYVAGKYSS
ncbi:MAG: type II secretion system GspH family protein [Patescibacteria group bacterium]|nr:type II secretion system GspH family protein [Patescibacteria group bacterium]